MKCTFDVVHLLQKNYETVINQYKKKLGKRNVDAIAMMCCHGIRGCAGDEEADEGSGREEYCISATKHGSGGGLAHCCLYVL